MTQTHLAWLPGDSEMGRRIRAHDWAATPLGSIEAWSPELRSATALALDSGFATALAWGPNLVTIYNDSFRPILGSKPEALGRSFADVWSEVWDEIGPIAERALTGQSTFLEDYRLLINRSGEPEEAFFTFSYSPVRAEDGSVLGMIDTVVETTEAVRSRLALRESETRFRAFVTASSDVVYRMGPDWLQMRHLDGQGFLANTGSPSEGWAGTYIPPEDRPTVLGAIADAVRDKKIFELEHRVRRVDGTVGWTLSRAVPILGDDGEVAEWLGAASDVTARKNAEESVRESEQRLKRVLETDAVAVLFFSRDGVLTDANDVFLRTTGYSRQDIETGRLTWQQMTPPEWLAVSQKQMDRFGVEGRIGPYEKEYLRKDGSRASMLFAGRDLGDGTIVEIGVDISARKHAELAQRESEERFAQFAASSSDGLWIRDAETLAMEYTSPAIQTIYGLPPDALLGDPERWAALIVPEDREVAFQHLEQARRGKAVVHEFRIRRASDGVERWIRDTDFPLLDVQGRIQRIGGIAEDITETKRLQERQGVLMAELQHRTRNLMGVVRSIANKTLERSSDFPDFRTRFSDRLAALARVQGLLSHLDEWERVTFDALIHSELAALDGERSQITLHGPEGVALRSSTVQTFALALHELTTNALKYGALARPQGRLDVVWRLETQGTGPPWLYVDWRESGVSISADGAASQGSGSGRELIERALPYQLGAKTTFVMAEDGVCCTIALPVSERQTI